jgi:hypothetical protein
MALDSSLWRVWVGGPPDGTVRAGMILSSIMDHEDVKREVERAAQEGRLTCPEARALAEKLGVDYSAVGRACNELNIKIHACALGCF